MMTDTLISFHHFLLERPARSPQEPDWGCTRGSKGTRRRHVRRTPSRAGRRIRNTFPRCRRREL